MTPEPTKPEDVEAYLERLLQEAGMDRPASKPLGIALVLLWSAILVAGLLVFLVGALADVANVVAKIQSADEQQRFMARLDAMARLPVGGAGGAQ